MNKQSWLPWAILLLTVGLTLRSWFQPGFPEVHDPTSIPRLYTLLETLRDGQIPAAWTNLLNYRHGYPLFLYYAPLFGLVSVLFSPLGLTLSVKSAVTAVSLFGTVGIYKLLQRYGRWAALLGAVAFTLLPYRAVQIYVRGAYAEFLAMSLLPWVLYSWSLDLRSKRHLAFAAATLTGLVLAHNSLFLLVLPFLVIYILLFRRAAWLSAIAASFLALGLSAWFTLPVLFARQLVQTDTIARVTEYRQHFLELWQLWISPWGYGGSSPGTSGDGMSFMVGRLHLGLAALGFLALAYRRRWRLLIFYAVLVVLSAWMTLPNSISLWEAIPTLQFLQFPWRSLALIGTGTAVLAGFCPTLFPARWQWLPAVAAGSILLFVNLKYFTAQNYFSDPNQTWTTFEYLDPLVYAKIPEYLPAAMPTFPDRPPEDGLTRTPTTVTGRLTLTEESRLVVETAYMPQWRLRVNGQPSRITPQQEGTIITLDTYPPGSYDVSLTWSRTYLEWLGIIISVLSLVLMVRLWR